VADKNIKLGVSLGVLGLGGLKSIFGQTRREVETLKGSTDKLTRASKAAGTAQVSFATQGRAALAKLKGSYDGLTSSLGGLRMAAMALAAVPVTMGLNKALDLQDVSIDLAMGMGLDASVENDLAALIQSASSSGNQTHTDTGVTAQALVTGGIRDMQVLGDYLPLLTQAATATRVGMGELTHASLALRDNLELGADGFARSMNILSHASNAGKMGVDGMIAALPGLSLRMKELGVTGDAAVAEIAAALQTARESAGSDSEAAANVDKFLDRITSDATRKRFESAGIVLKKSIENLTAQGLTPMEAMLDTVTQYVGSKGPQALKAFSSALSMDEGKAREEAFATLSARYALGDLFMDSGIQNFASAAMRSRDRFQSMKQDNLAAANKDLVGEDFVRRMTSGKEQLKALRIQLGNIGATLGGPLAGALVSTMQSLLPVINGFAQWAQDNPGMVKALLITAGGFAGLRLGIAGAGVTLRSGSVVLGVFKGAVFGVMNVARMLLPVLAGLSWPVLAIGAAVTAVAVLVWKFWEPIKAFMVGVWQGVSEAMSPVMSAFRESLAPLIPLWDGLAAGIGVVWGWIKQLFAPFQATSEQLQGATSAGQTFGTVYGKVLGALLLPLRMLAKVVGWVAGAIVECWDTIKVVLSWTPLGMIVTHWNRITGFFGALWDGISGIFSRAWDALGVAVDGGIAGISALILDWSPLGLFYKAFAGVMDWFGMELPDSFSGFGSMLIDGLVSGITGTFGKAKDAIVGIGESVTGWFRDTLGINSPSRVFMTLGAGIPEGAAKGITAAQGVVRKATLGMAAATAVTLAAPVMPAPVIPTPVISTPVMPTPITPPPITPTPVMPAPVIPTPVISAPVMPAPIAGRVPEAAALSLGEISLVGQAVAELSATITATRPERQPPPAQLQAARMATAPAQMTVQFSPTIQITAAAGDNVQQQVQRGLRMGMNEFRRMLREVEYQDRRTAFAGLSFANAPISGSL